MLKQLIEDALHQRNLSVRQAAREIGIAHTTLFRLMKGNPTDLETLDKTCTWLGVNLVEVLKVETNQNSDFEPRLKVLLDYQPELKTALEELVHLEEVGEIDMGLLDEIATYIKFLIQAKRAPS